jgi:hypothetical protein
MSTPVCMRVQSRLLEDRVHAQAEAGSVRALRGRDEALERSGRGRGVGDLQRLELALLDDLGECDLVLFELILLRSPRGEPALQLGARRDLRREPAL